MRSNRLWPRLVLAALCAAVGAGHFLFWKFRPSPAAAAYARGKALADARLTADAVAVYQEALRLDPRYAPPYRALAEIAADRGDLPTAIRRWQEYLALEPNAPHAWCRLTGVLMRAGRGTEALVTAERELKLAPDCGRAHLIAGLLYERKSQARPALEHLAAAMRAYPNDPRIALAYGRVLVLNSDYDRAEPILKEVIARDASLAEAYRWLGSLYARRAVTAENGRIAEQNLRRALELKPDYAEAHYELARLLFAQKRAAEALPSAEQAALRRKHYPRAFYLQAQIYAALGRPADAQRAQQQFRRESDLYARQEALWKRYGLNRDNVATGLELAETLLARDEPEAALRVLREIAPKAPGEARVQAALKRAESDMAARLTKSAPPETPDGL
jgi:tetratricopeptide (TPR) repeat protein